jgi:hypothetical protein
MIMTRILSARRGVIASLVGVAAVALGVLGYTAGALPAAQAASQDVSPAQKASVASKLENLHKKALDRTKAAEDGKAVVNTQNPALADMSPERAAQLAVQASGGGKPTWIARQIGKDGKPYYDVQVDTSSSGPGSGKPPGQSNSGKRLHVDAQSEKVTDGTNDPPSGGPRGPGGR